MYCLLCRRGLLSSGANRNLNEWWLKTSRFLCGFIIQLFAEENSIHGKSKYRSETRFKLLTALWHQLIDIIFLWEPLIWKHMCLHYQWLTWRRSGSDFGIKLPQKIQNKKLAIEIKCVSERFRAFQSAKPIHSDWFVTQVSWYLLVHINNGLSSHKLRDLFDLNIINK